MAPRPPNYNQARGDRNRAKEQKKLERLRRREEEVVGIVRQDDPRAELRARRLAERQLAQIDHWHRRAAIVEGAGDSLGRARQMLDADER